MTVVTAMGQMFYSLSIAMGILVTFGSYMKKDVSIEGSTENVEIFDTLIAMMAGLMIIPAVFSFSGGDPDTLQAGPALMFITIPKVFASMGFGTFAGVMFFVLVLFAALTSSIALTESAVATFEDEFKWSRKKATVVSGVIMIVIGSLSALGYGPLANVKIIGMQFLDFFDFLTNSVMMPIAALMTSLLVSRVIGVDKIEEEIRHGESAFRRKKIFVVKKVKVTKEELDIINREYAEYTLDIFWYYTDKERTQILTTNNEFDFCTLGWADHVFTEEFIGGLSDRRIKILNDKYVKALRKLGLDTLVILAEEQVITTSLEDKDFDEYFDNLVSYGSVAGPGFHIDIEYSFEITAKTLNVFTHFFKSLF